MAWWEAILGAVGAAVTAVATVAVSGFAWKTATHATDKSTEVQEKATAVEGFEKLVQSIQAERTEDRNRLAKFETKLGHAEVRITALEADLRKERTMVGLLIDYARRLRSVLREHHIDIPEPPTEVRDKF